MNRSKKEKTMLNFNVYIYKVLNTLHPDLAISSDAMDMMNNILRNMMPKLAQEASKCNKIRKKNSTLVARDISNAVMELFSGRMVYRAIYFASTSIFKISNFYNFY
ncbi:histone H2B [Trifolium pratense]|uniref:Histone H2B n=1 Tax=Trifolium pratense TaxID=57577 RepID=A0A2K3KSH2_TRIPR|nr:histone H2B [Trifolium pratense]